MTDLGRDLGVVSGTAVVDERVFRIVAVRLRNRTVVFEARAWGPIPAGSATSYTLHDEDGAVVVRALDAPGLHWDAVGIFHSLTLALPLAVDDRQARGARA